MSVSRNSYITSAGFERLYSAVLVKSMSGVVVDVVIGMNCGDIGKNNVDARAASPMGRSAFALSFTL